MKKTEKEAKALVGEMTKVRLEKRLSLRKVMVPLKAQYATVWRWERGMSVPNSFHLHHLKKWLGYL